MARVQHRQAHINSASIDSTGTQLLTSSADGLARIWQLPATLEDLAETARRTLQRCLSPRQREEFNRVARDLPDWCDGKLHGENPAPRTPATQAAVTKSP